MGGSLLGGQPDKICGSVMMISLHKSRRDKLKVTGMMKSCLIERKDPS